MRHRKKVLLPNSVLDVTLESCSMISPSSSAVPNYIYKQEVQKLTFLNFIRIMFLILMSVLVDPSFHSWITLWRNYIKLCHFNFTICGYEISWCYHSKESSLAWERLQSTIYFLWFYKKKFEIFLIFSLATYTGMKGFPIILTLFWYFYLIYQWWVPWIPVIAVLKAIPTARRINLLIYIGPP